MRPGAAVNFHNPQADRSSTLALLLCPICADRAEKHLKRMFPKRLFIFVP